MVETQYLIVDPIQCVLDKCEQLRLRRRLPLQALLYWWHGLPRLPIWWSHRDMLLHGLNIMMRHVWIEITIVIFWTYSSISYCSDNTLTDTEASKIKMLLFKVSFELKALSHWVLPNCCKISPPWIVCTKRWGMVNKGGKNGVTSRRYFWRITRLWIVSSKQMWP